MFIELWSEIEPLLNCFRTIVAGNVLLKLLKLLLHPIQLSLFLSILFYDKMTGSTLFIGSRERISQVETLAALITQPKELAPASIFVYGHSSSGKKHVVTSLLKNNGLKYLVFNCIESYSPKILFETILGADIGDDEPMDQDDDEKSVSCDNIMDFISRFQSKFNGFREDDTFFIVFTKSERMRNMGNHILPAFLRLQELTGCNVCTIFLSDVIWEKFMVKMGLCEPIKIFLPQYNKDEIVDILCHSHQSKYSASFYRNYLNMLLSAFYRITRNLVTIRQLDSKLFPLYCQPIEAGEVKSDDVSTLWRCFVPHLKNALQFGLFSSTAHEKNPQGGQLLQSKSISSNFSLNLDLPFHSKMLLIAAYLASHNSSKSDQLVFSKQKQKRKKSKKSSAPLKNIHINGPKPFSFDRMMAIFYCINESEKLHTSLLISQVSYLLSSHLMEVSSEDVLDEPKYICTVSYDMICNLARSIDFNIVQLLHG